VISFVLLNRLRWLACFLLSMGTICSRWELRHLTGPPGGGGCGDGFECGHHVGWFRVVRGGAACTLVLVYVSIRLSETVSEFRSIERFRTPGTVQQRCCI